MQVCTATENDLEAIGQMMVLLWPECLLQEELENNRALLASKKDMFFIAKANNEPLGFIHLSLRHEFVEGTETSPVGYIEGIFVYPRYRKTGLGKALVETGAKWCKGQGCQEMASDTETHNLTSIDFHLSLGFEEKNRIVCFAKKLNEPL